MRNLIQIALTLILPSVAASEESRAVEFDTGRPPAPLAGFPVMGSGLALSKGTVRGVPVVEMSEWTASIWFQPTSGDNGELMRIVLNEPKKEKIQLFYTKGVIRLNGDFASDEKKKANPKGWQFQSDVGDLGKWHQAVITFSEASGPAFYVDGKLVGEGGGDWIEPRTPFTNYQFGAGIDRFLGGLLDDFALYDRKLSTKEVGALYRGEAVQGNVVAFNDFENVSHRDLAYFSESDRDEAYLDEGAKLYQVNCTSCHSKDGVTPPLNPLSRMFTKNKMENGSDPFSMFKTLTYGFRNMMPAPQLNPEERYKVIHYLREQIIRKHAPELYIPVDASYTNAMPRTQGGAEDSAKMDALAKIGYLRDYGRALITPVDGADKSESSRIALVIDLGEKTTIGYDLSNMSSIGVWRGGFLDFSDTLHHKLRAPGFPESTAFDFIPGTENSRWAWDGKAESEPADRKPLTTWPEDQIRYQGHYNYGNEIIVSYIVQGRGVLESPIVKDGVVFRRLTIDPSDKAVELVVISEKGAKPVIEAKQATLKGGRMARLSSDREGPAWRVSAADEVVLHIPASKQPVSINVALSDQKGTSPAQPIINLAERTRGGPKRWSEAEVMAGRLAVSKFQGYALDSVPVPLKNKYNSWMRTAALALFPDGRLAVSTLSGDVWIVSGLNEELDKVTWRRFAAGLFEPLGMKVVDGILVVGTRGRIVKLHDYNGDGEADFYESFFTEPEPARGWHAYNFDLEVGKDGSFYYARVGGFSDWSVPGGLVRVSPDGKKWEVLGAGMRVPNGIGKLPDGRITFSDNQGKYVPASKIAVGSVKGSFHGAGSWTGKKQTVTYDPKTIVDPIVYLPQELDSSSGAQLWVEKDERFGPLGGQFFHTSFGRARTMVVMIDEFDDTIQGAVYPLPLPMESGTMRLAKNPADGQLYFSGLTGWQAGATREGSIQRLRYTGEGGLYLTDAKARRGRLDLTFSGPLDAKTVGKLDQWQATAWNYQWSEKYGSPNFKVSEPGVEGVDKLSIERLELSGDRTLIVHIPDLQPCNTLKLDFQVGDLAGPLYFTIHKIPPEQATSK